MTQPSTPSVANQPAFTPGPWVLNDRTIFGGPDEQAVAELCNRHHSSMAPNGRLIAAAPELLASVKDLLDQHEQTCKINGRGDVCIVTREAQAAIKKATGR